MPWLQAGLTALLLSVVLTRLFIAWADARDISAAENHRTMHKGQVAIGGGWPVLAAMAVAALLVWPFRDGLPAFLLPSLGVLAIVSWADDLKSLSARVRILVHIGTAAACVLAIPDDRLVLGGVLPLPVDRIVTAIALVWFVNLYNFMDGIDGIAGTETLAIAGGYALVMRLAGLPEDALTGFAVAAAGAAAGFLVWNWHPARIFLGDVGAVPMGFLMGALMIDLATRVSLAAAIILPLYFAADATITLAKRVAAGARPWDPHRDHYYQRAARGLGSHSKAVVLIAIADIVLVGLAALAPGMAWGAVALAAVTVGVLLVCLERAARQERGRT